MQFPQNCCGRDCAERRLQQVRPQTTIYPFIIEARREGRQPATARGIVAWGVCKEKRRAVIHPALVEESE